MDTDTEYSWPESHFSALPSHGGRQLLDSSLILPQQATPLTHLLLLRPCPCPFCVPPHPKTPFAVTATGERAYVKT